MSAAVDTPVVDTLLLPRWVIPIRPAGRVLAGHAVVLADGKIVETLAAVDAVARYPDAKQIDLPKHVVLPGLINLHTHAAMTLLRGYADDMALMPWLHTRIWPAEMKLMSADFVRDGTLLACAEMLLGGVTCMNDMYFFPEAAAQAVRESHMRAALGIILLEFPSPYAADPDDYLAKGLRLRDELKGEPRFSFTIAPHAPYSVSDKSFEKALTFADELGLPVHVHVHETADEIRRSLEQYGVRPLQRLQKLGLLTPALIAVHAVHLDEAEIALLAEHGCSIAHCPASNMKLASGFAPVTKMLQSGINVGIGTDGAASNNRLDMFAEMRLAALLAKAFAGDATALPAFAALEMVTINAARALGLDERIGSIEPGKDADLIAVEIDGPGLAPCYDPVSHLVYAAGRENVSDVWVAGENLVRNRELAFISLEDLEKSAFLWQNRLAP
jgi:5-methylthioadenosine/S-adenosylhomocysteine deaminase